MIGFNRRFDPNFKEVRAQVAAGVIGAAWKWCRSPLAIPRRRQPPMWRASGGLFRDMTIHDFDMAAFLLGEDPVSVFAAASNLVDPAIGAAGDVDSACARADHQVGKDRSDFQFAAGDVRIRSTYRGSRFKGLVSAENVRDTTVEVADATGTGATRC